MEEAPVSLASRIVDDGSDSNPIGGSSLLDGATLKTRDRCTN